MLTNDPRCNVEPAYEDFLLALEVANRSPRTLDYYRDKLSSFLAYLDTEHITQIAAITPHHIRTYMQARQKTVSALTLHHNVACIRAWCNWLVAEELLPNSPLVNIKQPRVDKRILPAFAPENVKELLGNAGSLRNKTIILCLLDTGLRASEFVALDIRDVDISSGAIHVRKTKAHTERMVYLGARSRRALAQYLASRGKTRAEDPLWPSIGNKRLTVNGLHLILKRVGKKAGVEHCHAHTFRRTFALWSLRAGMNIYELQRLMGHKGLSMLQQYLDLAEHDLATSHREHGAVDSTL
jgi:site-specific recombinase XerD